MTTVGSNYITGITTATQGTDGVYKSYVDNLSTIPSQTGNAGKFLLTTDGISVSWDYVSNYQEFSTTGSPQTFTVPSQANILYIEAIGGGGGGSTGTTGSTFAKNGLTWTLRTSGFGSSSITNITSNGTTYVISGTGGGLRSSTDTINWVSRTSGFGTSNINGLSYANNEYLIGGRVETISWNFRTSGFGGSFISGLIYGNGIFVASASGGNIRASTDGIAWRLRTNFPITPWWDVDGGIYDGTNYFLSGGATNAGALITSTDSIIWILRTSGFGIVNLNTISYGSNQTQKYIIGGNGVLRSSTDSISWVTRTYNGFNILTSTYDGIRYYAGGVGPNLISSTDAINWVLRTAGISATLQKIIYGSVFVLNTTNISTSTDGIMWTLRTSGFGTSVIYSIAYNDGLYVAGDSGGRIATSTDAITWISRTSGISNPINEIVYGANNYVAGCDLGIILVSTQPILSSYGTGARLQGSTDGITWFLRTNNTLNSQTITLLGSGGPYAFAHGTNYMGEYDFLNVSTNNIVWQLRTSGFGRSQITSFGYGGTIYVAGGASGTLTVSTNTITWILRTSGFGTTLIDALIYENGIYVAGGVFGILTTSTDTIVWTLRTTSSGTDTINSLSYSNTANSFIFAGDFGDIFTSTNAIVWKVNTSSTTANLLTSLRANNTYLVAGESGTLVKADAQLSGTGGSGGSYTSWYIPDSIISSNITVNVGSGGPGATTESESGSAGAGTTISWTGPGGTYTLTSSGGDAFKDFSFVNRPRTVTIFGTSSSSPSRIILPTNPRLDLSTSNFTVEFWLKTNGTQSANATIIDSGTANNSVYIGIGANMSSTAGKVSFKVGDTYPIINGETTVTDGVWRHIACVKSGSDVYIFVNGVIDASSPSSAVNSIASFSDGRIGGSRWSTGQFTDNGIVASLSNFRISNIARYTSTFSPFTTKFSVDSNTVLFLPLDSLPSIDLSSNQFVLGTQGASLTTETAIFQPFNYFYATAGGSGGITTTGIGVTVTAQANSYQSTGGGSGAGTPSSAGGAGGSITFYGNTIFSAGGSNTGSNGAVGIAITSLPYGFGGGGGGAGASSAGAGGAGIRGGGGGGGAAIGSTFANGGNGGDGFVRITWW